MIYEWDAKKAIANERTHGVSFEEPRRFSWIRWLSRSMIRITRLTSVGSSLSECRHNNGSCLLLTRIAA